MKRRPVDSSNIASIGWDPKSMILEIEFLHGGIYQYKEVPKQVFGDFLAADSIGKYFHKYVKSTFDYKRIEQDADSEWIEIDRGPTLAEEEELGGIPASEILEANEKRKAESKARMAAKKKAFPVKAEGADIAFEAPKRSNTGRNFPDVLL